MSLSLMALFDPQSVMDLVGVELGNTDALSSIRGVYGGVGVAICLSLLYLMIHFPEKGRCFPEHLLGSLCILPTHYADIRWSFGRFWKPMAIDRKLYVLDWLVAVAGIGVGAKKQKLFINRGI